MSDSIDSPLISVVMPSYNHGNFIGRSIQSVLSQTYKNIELIIVDNNSTDDTDEVITRFSDNRITLLKIQNNGVIAASRNRGIQASAGEWVAFLDSDDWWKTDKLERCMAEATPDTALIYHDMQLVDESLEASGDTHSKSRRLCKPVLEDLLINGNTIANSSVVVRKSILLEVKGLDEEAGMVGCEDYNVWLKIARISENFLYIPEYLGSYLYHSDGVSRKDMILPREAAMKPFLQCLSKNILNKVRLAQTKKRYSSGRVAYARKDYVIAYRKFIDCVANGDLILTAKVVYMLVMSGIRVFMRKISRY